MKKEIRKYRITLKDKISGYKRSFIEKYEVYEDGTDIADYMWHEGNYSCDCNRSLFLWNWKREELPCNNGDNQIKLVELKELQ